MVVDTLLLEGDNHQQVGSQVLEDSHQVLGGTHQELVGNQGREGTLQMEDILVLEDNPEREKPKISAVKFYYKKYIITVNIYLFNNNETMIIIPCTNLISNKRY